MCVCFFGGGVSNLQILFTPQLPHIIELQHASNTQNWYKAKPIVATKWHASHANEDEATSEVYQAWHQEGLRCTDDTPQVGPTIVIHGVMQNPYKWPK